MTDTPWQGDATSLVDAFRSGERSPLEELDATYAAIERSDLNAFCHLDPERARAAAKDADLTKPFGGVPVGLKQLDPVEGWPYNEASLVFKDRIAPHTSVALTRLMGKGGIVPVGQTTASEFGGLNVSVTKINGVTHNPWRHGRTVGGSSSGSSAAVAGWPGEHRLGWRRRRLDPHPRRLHRPARHEGHLRPHPAQPQRLHAPQHRRAGLPGPVGARRGPLLRRVLRSRLRRPDEPAVPPELRGRPSTATT